MTSQNNNKGQTVVAVATVAVATLVAVAVGEAPGLAVTATVAAATTGSAAAAAAVAAGALGALGALGAVLGALVPIRLAAEAAARAMVALGLPVAATAAPRRSVRWLPVAAAPQLVTGLLLATKLLTTAWEATTLGHTMQDCRNSTR